MKFKNMFITLGLALGLGVGVVAGVSANQEVKVAEATTTTGSLIVKLDNRGKWCDKSADLRVYLTDETNHYWTAGQTISSDKALYKVDYSIEFTPTKLIVVRYNPALDPASQGNHGFDGKWNQSGDLGWKEATYLSDQWDPSTGQCSQWKLSADVRNADNSVKATLSNIYINESGNPAVSGRVTLTGSDEFYVYSGDGVSTGYYGVHDTFTSNFAGGSRSSLAESSTNITCNRAGEYDFFFDTETKRTWITNNVIVEADVWAQHFLEDVECDPDGLTRPVGWDDSADEYALLSDDAKDLVYGTSSSGSDRIASAVKRYDWAVSHNPTLGVADRFIVDSEDHVRATVRVTPIVSLNETASNNTALIIVLSIAAVSVLALGGYFFIRSRKED